MKINEVLTNVYRDVKTRLTPSDSTQDKIKHVQANWKTFLPPPLVWSRSYDPSSETLSSLWTRVRDTVFLFPEKSSQKIGQTALKVKESVAKLFKHNTLKTRL